MWTAQSRTMTTESGSVDNLLYTRHHISPELVAWINSNISEHIDQIGFQISAATQQSTTHLCHTDSYPRKWVLNYLVDLGGSDVTTNFYYEQGHGLLRGHLERPLDMTKLDKIYSVKIETGRWHILNALILHDVTGIETARKSVSAGIATENPFSILKGITI